MVSEQVILRRNRADPVKVGLQIVCCLAAFGLGFVWVPEQVGANLITKFGYYYILGVFAAWVVLMRRVVLAQRIAWRNHRLTVALLLTATAFAVWTDTFNHKLLFDDYVLQGTAWHIHVTKEVATPIRSYDISGSWLDINTFLDKRPYFFAFLLSTLHDLTGFRLGNVYLLNVALAFLVLSCVYWIVHAMTGRRVPAYVAVALLATLPLFGQNATGASMELLNLAMIALLLISSVHYLREPAPDRLSLVALGAVLLSQTRYESVLFVVPTGMVVLLGWWKRSQVTISWPLVITPLLLVPYAWHDRFVNASKYLWQLREGEQSRFALRYLTGNLEGAWAFFSSTSAIQPNSVWLVLMGVAGLGWAVVRKWDVRKVKDLIRSAEAPAVILFSVTIAGNLGLLMFYYWSRLDDPTATRFALPAFLVLAIASGWLVHQLDQRGLRGSRVAVVGLAGWVLIMGAPAYAKQLYTTRNLIMHELEWEVDQVSRRQGPVMLITYNAVLPFLLRNIPTLTTSYAPARASQIAWHMSEGTFREVLVSQLVRPTSAEYEPAVDPESELPESFRLEPIAMHRVGVRWIRLSRLVKIETIEAAAIVGNASPAQ